MTEHAQPKGGFAAELASLRKFKGRVDELLRTLDESDGAPSKVADTGLTQAHLGEHFNAAEALYGVYHSVHTDLVTLSKLLNDQISALGDAMLEAHGGYATTDADEREKLWAIHERMQRQYDPKLDPDAEAAQPHTSRTGPRTELRADGGSGNNGSGRPTHF
ncbi:hypothetical protein ABZY03_28595 [Streptomyces klenkii]|uniref:hypothetical protein n=1 Tax=Streptomyces klenkii TaxID=1420899 RepID=UPI0033BBBE69